MIKKKFIVFCLILKWMFLKDEEGRDYYYFINGNIVRIFWEFFEVFN